MPRYARYIQLPEITYQPTPKNGEVIVYGTNSGLGQSTNNSSSTGLDIAGLSLEFNGLSANSFLIGKCPANLTLSEVIVKVVTPFNNANTSISVGTLSDAIKFVDISETDLTMIATYKFSPNYLNSSDTDVYLFINEISSIGSGIVQLFFN